jgi:hypothetical protein
MSRLWELTMKEVLAKSRKNGIIAGAICFAVLYLPLLTAQLAVIWGEWENVDYWIALIAFNLMAMIIAGLIAGFFGYWIAKKDKILIILALIIVAIAFVVEFVVSNLITHPMI